MGSPKADMAQTPARRSAAATTPDPNPQPPAWQPQQPGQGMPRLAYARMAVSQALGGICTDETNTYLKAGFLSLPGIYEALNPLLAEHHLSLSTAAVYSAEAGMFVVRTTVVYLPTGESDRSDFPIGSIAKRDDIGGSMTYGTRYNIFALFSFFPDRDCGDSAIPAQQGGWQMPQAVAAPAQQGGWQLPSQQPPAQLPPAAGQPWPQPQQDAGYDMTRAYTPEQIASAVAWAPQTGTQRTEPLAQPTHSTQFAPQVLQ